MSLSWGDKTSPRERIPLEVCRLLLSSFRVYSSPDTCQRHLIARAAHKTPRASKFIIQQEQKSVIMTVTVDL